jgi:hypothetical protein
LHGDGGSVKGGNRGDRKQAAAMEQGQGKKGQSRDGNESGILM